MTSIIDIVTGCGPDSKSQCDTGNNAYNSFKLFHHPHLPDINSGHDYGI